MRLVACLAASSAGSPSSSDLRFELVFEPIVSLRLLLAWLRMLRPRPRDGPAAAAPLVPALTGLIGAFSATPSSSSSAKAASAIFFLPLPTGLWCEGGHSSTGRLCAQQQP